MNIKPEWAGHLIIVHPQIMPQIIEEGRAAWRAVVHGVANNRTQLSY